MAQSHERERHRVRTDVILDYLGGLTFPCSRGDVLRMAIDQGAPDIVVRALESLPEEPFSSYADITRHYGRFASPR